MSGKCSVAQWYVCSTDAGKDGKYLWLYSIRHVVIKEGNVLFNDALNTFGLQLYVVDIQYHCHHFMAFSFRSTARILYMHHPTHQLWSIGWNQI